MNKWNRRPQSPSAIPVLLRKQPICASAENLSHSRPPSPVKSSPGSRIPTPIGSRIHHGSSEPNLSFHKTPVHRDKNCQQFLLASPNENMFGFENQLEEILLPSSPTAWSDKHIEETFLVQSKFDLHDVLTLDTENQKNSSKEKFSDTALSHENILQKNYSESKNKAESKTNVKCINTGTLQGSKNEKGNVLYITENLIKKIATGKEIASIKSLNLSVYKQYKRKIQFIENLGNLKNLQCLNLSNNFIQKIQNLQLLVKLQELDLSHNQIKMLDGLEALLNLEKLNVSHNQISTIPSWFGKKLLALNVLIMSSNNIKKIDEATKLSPLSNLTEIEFDDNPCTNLDHFFEFVVFHLRTINLLNQQHISKEMRSEADQRFSLSEVSKKNQEILHLTNQNVSFSKNNVEFDEDRKRLIESEKKLKEKLHSMKKLMHEKSSELKIKSDLLDSKTTELNKACEKQYKLEQELAFYKLDAKFDEIWHMYEDDVDGNDTIVKQNFDENPYLGKARYKPNSMAKENIILTEEQSVRFTSFISRLDHNDLRRNSKVMLSLEKALGIGSNEEDDTLTKKEKELEQQILTLKQQSENSASKMSKLMEENNKLTDDCRKFAKLKDEEDERNKESEENVKQYQTKLMKLEDENSALLNQVKENQKLKSDLIDTKGLLKENKMLKENYHSVLSECESRQQEVQDKIIEHNQVSDFLEALTRGILQGQISCLPKEVQSKPMKAALVNLENAILNQQSDVNNRSSEMHHQIKDLHEKNENLQIENVQLNDEIKSFKEKLDSQESSERMRSHELKLLREQSKTTHEQNLQTIKEYDDIANEMRSHLESFEEKQASMRKELERKDQQIAKGKKSNHELKETLLRHEKLFLRNKEKDKELEHLEERNKKIEHELKLSRGEATSIKQHIKVMEEKFRNKLQQNEEEHNNELGKLLDELRLTKRYIESLQDDVNNNITSTNLEIQRLKQNVKNIEALLKEACLEQQKIVNLKGQMKNIKSSLQDLSGGLRFKDFLHDTYGNVSEKIDELENRLNSKQTGDEQNAKDLNEKLMQALRQIEYGKDLLEEKQQELDSSNIPHDLISLQRKEISDLLEDLDKKERELRKFHSFEGSFQKVHCQKNSCKSPDQTHHQQNTTLHRDMLGEDSENLPSNCRCDGRFIAPSEEPHVIHHKHFFDTDANAFVSENILKSARLNSTPMFSTKNKPHGVDREIKNLDRGCDDLRWELSRLEAKVGDAMLHRSMYRRRYPQPY